MQPECKVVIIHGFDGWKHNPLTLADLISNFVLIILFRHYIAHVNDIILIVKINFK